MDNPFTPKQIAKKLHISTTTLRRYEVLDLVPDVPRTASNRRFYSPVHVQAFMALRALIKGFAIPVSYDVMSLLKKGRVEQALWKINLQSGENRYRVFSSRELKKVIVLSSLRKTVFFIESMNSCLKL
ncbi:MerR family DNA-binding transcriptional regulator [uncultured Paenibacillus sp.]|uniref:MerR family DNA-binding transcriptional regulator n=1 Tax=uncultured Paenibacillus sp. TaxID=227322 RepID=UPI0015AA2166|nr:MerR family DNA-binding transcriptional regulator [uncultured Paenibacillus sp.]